MTEARFKVGDLTVMAKPFYFNGDGDDWDADKDQELRRNINDGSNQVICKIELVNPHGGRDYEHYQVSFVNSPQSRPLYIDGKCLEPMAASEEEIQAAIQSILGA